MSRTFTCAGCKGTFKTEWSEEEAQAEYKKNWGEHMGEELETLCDECHKKMMSWYRAMTKELQGKMN